jgi:RNA polymerase sigma-70 factor, ECF subfamily
VDNVDVPPSRPDPAAPGALAADGRRTRIAALYASHADFVVRIARQLGAPAGEVEDVVHEVFLVVHRRLADYDDTRGSMRGWLYGVTRNVVHAHRRTATRSEQRLRLLPDPEPRPGPDEHLAEARAGAAVDAFLAQLDEDRRMVFSLIDIEGLSAPEVAEALGVNINTVYSRLRLARQQFNQYVRRLHGEKRAHDGRA